MSGTEILLCTYIYVSCHYFELNQWLLTKSIFVEFVQIKLFLHFRMAGNFFRQFCQLCAPFVHSSQVFPGTLWYHLSMPRVLLYRFEKEFSKLFINKFHIFCWWTKIVPRRKLQSHHPVSEPVRCRQSQYLLPAWSPCISAGPPSSCGS